MGVPRSWIAPAIDHNKILLSSPPANKDLNIEIELIVYKDSLTFFPKEN